MKLINGLGTELVILITATITTSGGSVSIRRG